MHKGTTESYNNLIRKSGRTFRARLLIGETVLEGFSSIKLTHGSNNGDALTLGSTICQCAEITMSPPDISLTGKEFELQIGLVIEEDVEYVPMGFFTPEKIKNKNDQITFSSYDRMMKLSAGFSSNLSDTTDTLSVLARITEITGVPISTDGLTAIAVKRPEGYTCREVLMYIAQLYGCFANVNREGTIELHFWEDSGYELTAEQGINGFSHEDNNFTVEAIICSTGQDEEGNVIALSAGTGTNKITFSNPFMTQTILNSIYSKIKGFSYTPVECPVNLGDPRLDPWDLIQITDAQGYTYSVPLMSLTYSYDGGLSCTITSTSGSESETTYDYKGPMQQFEERINAKLMIVEALTATKISAEELSVKVAELGYLTATEADIKYATITNLNATNATISALSSKAITTENLSAKVAELGYAKVTELEVVSGKITTLESKAITTENLSAKVAELGYLTATEADIKYATITSLNATDAKITTLTAKAITTDTLSAKVAELGYLKAEDLEAEVGSFGYLKASEAELKYATITNLSAANASITTLQAKVTEIEKAYITDAEIEELLADYATIESLDATNATITDLISKAITTDNLSAKVALLGYLKADTAQLTYATISSLNATTAKIDDLVAIAITTENLSAKVAEIGYLKADELEASVAKFGYLKAEVAEIIYATIDLANVKDGSITNAMIGTGVVDTAQIADSSITDAKIVGLTANKITAGKLDAGVIEVVNLNAANITVGTINGQQISDGAIDTSKLTSGAVTSDKIAVSAVLADNIAAGAVTTDKLVSEAVTADKIAANAITANKIVSGAITTDKLAALAVTADKIAAGTITATQIASNAITTDKLAANSVTAAKINVTDLFAQDITATGSITGMKFVSSGTDNEGYPSIMTLDSGALELVCTEDTIYNFITYISGHHSTYTYKVTGGAYNDLSLNGNYIKLTYRPDGLTGTATTVFNASSNDNLVTCSNLKVAGTSTFAGNVYLSATGKSYYLVDSTGFQYPGIRDNGTNLWIGALQTAATHHTGETYISSGYNASSEKGNVTIKISVPNTTNTNATNYAVLHAGNYTTYAAAASHTHSTLDGLTATITELNYCSGVTSNIQTQLNNKMAASISSIELNASGSLTNYGGFIDFHFNGSSADYTSRIIEQSSGVLTITGGLTVKNGLALSSGASIAGTLSVTGTTSLASVSVTGATTTNTLSVDGIAAFNGAIHAVTGITLYNETSGGEFLIMNSSGTALRVMSMGSSDNLGIGAGLYNAGTGITNIYGGTGARLLIPYNSKSYGAAVSLTGESSYPAAFRPYSSGTTYLGTASYKWYKIYAANATVQTSDRREKENIMPFGNNIVTFVSEEGESESVDLHTALFDRLQPVQYNFIKGDRKICYGLIAQDVLETLRELEICETELDLVQHDWWTDEETGEQKDSYGIAYNNLIAMLIYEVQKLKKQVAALS